MSGTQPRASVVQLRAEVICPHCWHGFPPHKVLWISRHSDLLGDPLLGGDAQRRFLPTRFNVEGHAVDVKGEACQRLACPKCHLSVSRAFLEMKPIFISILGAPGSGKSYFLASMTWQLRNTLQRFGLTFEDADPVANQILSGYEESLFLNANEDKLVTLPKTQKEGEHYESVKYGDRVVWYPRPFVFAIQPLETHQGFRQRAGLSRALCLYDNAGEHFLLDGESANSPGTQHMALSQALLFLFDPTQHPKFRKVCHEQSDDPQMGEYGWSHRQDQVLFEAAKRIREYSGMAHNAKYERPLVVVVTKYDAWRSLTQKKRLRTDWVVHSSSHLTAGLDVDAIGKISTQVRSLLMKYSPEVVTAAESFAANVTYIPMSAMGGSPEVDAEGGFLGFRPRDIDPMWVEIPILYVLNQVARNLVRSGKRAAKESETHAAVAGETPDQRETRFEEPPRPRIWRQAGS